MGLKPKIIKPNDFINPLLSKKSVSQEKFEKFQTNLNELLKVNKTESEEHQKNAVRDFLVHSFGYEINTEGRIDWAIFKNGKVEVLIEAKRLDNLSEMLTYPICATLSHKLSWSHIVELLKISDDLEREFYEKQTVLENWSIRELQRQKESGLFLRLSLNKNKKDVLALSQNGQIIEKPTDILRDPYIFEFLKISEPYHIAETQLESLLCDNLQNFLLELGRGFTFVGRQYKVTLNNTHYKVDLVFYHRILRCFVLIDLKINEVKHQDIGQMNMYLGYFANEQNTEGDNPPIGIILSKEKDELLVEYATYGMNSQLFVQKYQLYLPNKEELRKELESVLKGDEEIKIVEGEK